MLADCGVSLWFLLQELSEADAKVVSERCEVAEPLGDSAMQVEV